MPLTKPENFIEKGGIDERDQNHPNFPKKVIKVFLKPLTQKVIEKELWFEVIISMMIFFTGIGELIGRKLSFGWFIILFLSLFIVAFKMWYKITAPIEDKKVIQPLEAEEEKEIK